ncbi:putative phage abortive infection protein [Serratia sp. BNK-10]|uniref:putative phage abortive infection protein n=1 Tax=Serratia sp. BNK-10 TaxID=3376147 RepID=UPI0039BF1D3A
MSLVYSSIFILCFVYSLLVYFGAGPFEGWRPEEIGQFGDSWGVLTSIFSAFAFAAVIHNNFDQKKTIESTREFANKQMDFMNTQTNHLDNQTAFLKNQNEFLRVQKIESSLFQLLSLLQSIISDIDVVGQNSRSGRDCFKFFYNEFRTEYRKSILNGRNKIVLSEKEIIFFKDNISLVYSRFYVQKQQDLGHYFRFLFNIFKFIDDAELSDLEKKKYSNIVRAQLSNYELGLLFYNCIYKEGRKFEIYAKRFELFDNMPNGMYLEKNHSQLINH